MASIRKIITERNNCDDIALNFIANYYFPEFRNIYIKSSLEMDTHPQTGQSNLKNHIPFRNECLNAFTKILGFNPLRYTLKKTL